MLAKDISKAVAQAYEEALLLVAHNLLLAADSVPCALIAAN